ncbi:MAG TPA: VOC family protein [Pirellulales bacterium]|nr:VOC family protein [Pirellulales bacterium]
MIVIMLAHITLATRDVRRTAMFYAQVFGWTSIPRPANVPASTFWLRIAPGLELHLNRVDDFQPPSHEGEYGRHMAVAYPGEDFASLKDRLRQQGAEIIAADRATPFERFFFRDPNGYVFEVIETRRAPEEAHHAPLASSTLD